MLASGFRPVGRDFPVFLHPDTNEEYALARTERKTAPGYRGFIFLASPDVTLEQDLPRRDLTINAMARGEDGRLSTRHGGQADLAAGLLRHVSPAFVEDPLRVLRVARFAARLGFTVAPETEALMRASWRRAKRDPGARTRLAGTGERALGSAAIADARRPARMRRARAIAAGGRRAVRCSGAARVEFARVRGRTRRVRHVARALDWSADHGQALPARYGILVHDLGHAATARDASPVRQSNAVHSARVAENVSERLKVPLDCRDAARLAARWHGNVDGAMELRPAKLLDLLLHATDALRRRGGSRRCSCGLRG